MGVGGTLSALGGDFGALSTNPAGLATYRASNFTISLGYRNVDATAQLSAIGVGGTNPSNTVNAGNVTFNNLGLVLASVDEESFSGWKTSNFAIGYNRLADYGQEVYYSGRSTGSIVERWADNLDFNQSYDDFDDGVGYDANAVYKKLDAAGKPILVNGKNIYLTDYDNSLTVPLQRSERLTTTGGLGEFQLAYAANYKDRVYIGATLGIPLLNYTQTSQYLETDAISGVPIFDKLEYNKKVTINGAGINLKIGTIVRLNQMFRVGLAVHTPSAMNLDRTYNNDVKYNYTDGGTPKEGKAQSPDGVFNYRLNTPWRLIGSTAIVFGKVGFLTAEAEWVNYAGANYRYDSAPAEQASINNEIKSAYKNALQIRVGGEIAVETFRFRVGYGIENSPYQDKTTVLNTYSAGVGIRGKTTSFDLAYRYADSGNFAYTPYYVNPVQRQQQVSYNSVASNFLATLSFRF